MNKEKKLTKNVLVMAIGQFSSKVLGFLLVPLYTSVLSTEEFGIYDTLIVTISLLTPILTIVISEAVMRFCLDEGYDNDQVLSVGVWFSVFGTLLLFALYPEFRLFSVFEQYFGVFVIMFLITNLHSVFTQYLKGVEKVELFTLCGVISTITTITFNILFLVVLKWAVWGYMLAHIFGHIFIVLFICLKIRIWRIIKIPHRIPKKTYKDMIKYALPMMPNSISWWVSNSSSKYIILAFLSTSALGIYSVSSRIPSIGSVFLTIFMGAWQISAVEDFGSEESKKFFSRIYNMFFSMGIVAGSALICSAKFLGFILYQNEFFEAWKLSVVLIFAFVFNAQSAMLGSIYTSAKKTNMLFYSTIIAAIINIVFNILFIKSLGIMSAAVSTLISYAVVWLIRLIDSRKLLKLDVDLKNHIVGLIVLIVQSILMIYDTYVAQMIAILLFVVVLTINIKMILELNVVQKFIYKIKNRNMRW